MKKIKSDNINNSSITIAILACITSSTALATNYTNSVDASNITLQSGDSINTTDEQGVVALDPSKPIDIGDLGSLFVSVNTTFINARGIASAPGVNLNLGSGTSINLNGTSSAVSASAIGINMGSNAELKANAIDINVTAVKTAIGIDANGGGSSIDLGNNSVIRANSSAGNSSAIFINQNNTIKGYLNADKLYLEASGNVANGLNVYGNNDVNIGSDSVIHVTGMNNSAGIHLGGSLEGTVNANAVNISANGNNTVGVRLDNTNSSSSINLGSNSTIITSGDNSSGIYSNANNSASFTADTISIQTNGVNSHAIESHAGSITINAGSQLISNNGAGILASGLSSTIKPQVTINDSSVYGKTIGVSASDAEITLNNTSVTSTGTAISANDGGHVWFNGTGNISSIENNSIDANGGYVDVSGKSNISGNISSQNSSVVNIDLLDISTLSGSIQTSSDSISNIKLSSGSSWYSMGDSSVTDLTLDNSSLYISGTPTAPEVRNSVTVMGNYEGNNGHIYFDTVLNGDGSPTDKLIVNGNTNGSSLVSVNNVGGTGAQTVNGIELIHVDGNSDGEFIQEGRIVAGVYDYSLVRGQGNNSSNWYLTSKTDPTDPTDQMVERPEAGAYSANLAAANTMFVTRLHDRLGETQYIDALTGEKKVTSMWLRNEGGHNRSRDEHGQLRTQANRYVMQMGGDIAQWSHNGMDRYHLGVMVGYGNSKSNTVSSLSGYNAKGTIDGYSTGIYGTWYANEADKSGLYVDGWAQYSWFDNTVDGQNLSNEKYKSRGMTVSVESGYTFKMGENAAKNANYFIQPKAQVTWMGVKANDHTEANGTNVLGEGDDNIQTRLGVKAFMNGYADQDKGKDRVFQPFVEANWIHNTKDFGTNMDGLSVKQDGAANIAELKVGVEGQINKKVNLWGNVGQQLGNKGYSDTAVMLGIKYNF